MAIIEVGLGSRSSSISPVDLAGVAAALDKQAKRDLAPIWGVSANVRLLEDTENVPLGVSPIIIVDQMPGTMKGVHANQNGVAFAMILATEGWSLSASHECIEMLIDPSGEATREGLGLTLVDGVVQDTADLVDFILEASDPCEDPSHGYEIDGVLVSDFYTQRYFDATAQPSVQYSKNGGITQPRRVAPNGYLSWRERGTGILRQLRCFGTPEIRTLAGPPAAAALEGEGDRTPTLRTYLDKSTETPRVKRMALQKLPPIRPEGRR